MGFEPGFLTAARAAIAGILGLILILVLKQKTSQARLVASCHRLFRRGDRFSSIYSACSQYMNAAHSIVLLAFYLSQLQYLLY